MDIIQKILLETNQYRIPTKRISKELLLKALFLKHPSYTKYKTIIEVEDSYDDFIELLHDNIDAIKENLKE